MACEFETISAQQGQSIYGTALALYNVAGYEYGDGRNGDTDGDGKPEVDCSYLVYTAIIESGVLNSVPWGNDCFPPYPAMTTANIANNPFFELVEMPQVGDVVLFERYRDGVRTEGHMGLYTGLNPYYAGATGVYFGSQGGKGTGFANFTDSDQPGNQIPLYYGDMENRTSGGLLDPVAFIGYFRLKLPQCSCQPDLPTKPEDPQSKRRRDPLIIDLGGDGIRTLPLSAGNFFDFNSDGFLEATAWVAPGDGLLTLDTDGNGYLDSGRELFGDFTVLGNGLLAANGFQALEQFDGNEDGKIDTSDLIWTRLRIWRWPDGDNSESEEGSVGGDYGNPSRSGTLSGLDDLGITAIFLNSSISGMTDGAGNIEARAGTFQWADGTTGAIAEYNLQRDASVTIPAEYLPVPEDVAALPNLKGYGNVFNLDQAMVRDTTGQLKTLVQSFASATDVATRSALLEQIIFKWTGADRLAANARGPYMDGRRVYALEKFYGDAPRNPSASLAVDWENTYKQLFEIFYGKLISEVQYKDLYDRIQYAYDEASSTLKVDLSDAIAELESRLASNPEAGKTDLSEFARSLRGLQVLDQPDYLAFRETFLSLDPGLGWVIDSGGLPVITRTNHSIGGTNLSEAILRDPTVGDYCINAYSGNDVTYGSDRNEIVIQELGDAVIVAGAGDDQIWAGGDDDVLDGGVGKSVNAPSMAHGPRLRPSGDDAVIRRNETAKLYRHRNNYQNELLMAA